MTTALILHHDAESDAGLVGRRLARLGVTVRHHRVCERVGDPTPARPFPDLAGTDVVVLMGSRWSVDDTAAIGAWIGDELDWCRRAAVAGVGMLGICFGAQVLAAAHGGSAQRAPRPEYGWCTVDSDHPVIGRGPWFQWHGDCVTPPPGAAVLGTSDVCVQAYELPGVLAVQFHPEVDRDVLSSWITVDRQELVDHGLDPAALLAQIDERVAEVTPRTDALVDWALERLGPA